MAKRARGEDSDGLTDDTIDSFILDHATQRNSKRLLYFFIEGCRDSLAAGTYLSLKTLLLFTQVQ